ncbi:MAG: phosphoribosyltransferase [Pseudomonadota bacterium]
MQSGRFADRTEAGRMLAQALKDYAFRENLLVLALPRGGVPVAFEVACALGAPLDVFVVRKLGVPGQEEYAMGAIAAGVRVLSQEVVRALGISGAAVDAVVAKEAQELARREQLYRAGRPPLDVRGKEVILVDDGLATGATMEAALHALRAQQPARLVAAVPVAPPATCERLRPLVDELVAVLMPDPFHAVGLWYSEFPQTSDDEVRDLLARAPRTPAAC